MLILERITALVTSGDLYLLEISMRDEYARRIMVLSPDLHSQIAGPWRTKAAASRFADLRGDLEHFVSGGHISMHLDPAQPKKSAAAKNAQFGLLARAEHGMFDIRSRHPCPALRVLGGFAAKDVFVAIECHPRSKEVPFLNKPPLLDRRSNAWGLAIASAMERWEQWFGNIRPLSGSDCRDFLSDNASVVV